MNINKRSKKNKTMNCRMKGEKEEKRRITNQIKKTIIGIEKKKSDTRKPEKNTHKKGGTVENVR